MLPWKIMPCFWLCHFELKHFRTHPRLRNPPKTPAWGNISTAVGMPGLYEKMRTRAEPQAFHSIPFYVLFQFFVVSPGMSDTTRRRHFVILTLCLLQLAVAKKNLMVAAHTVSWLGGWVWGSIQGTFGNSFLLSPFVLVVWMKGATTVLAHAL